MLHCDTLHSGMLVIKSVVCPSPSSPLQWRIGEQQWIREQLRVGHRRVREQLQWQRVQPGLPHQHPRGRTTTVFVCVCVFLSAHTHRLADCKRCSLSKNHYTLQMHNFLVEKLQIQPSEIHEKPTICFLARAALHQQVAAGQLVEQGPASNQTPGCSTAGASWHRLVDV